MRTCLQLTSNVSIHLSVIRRRSGGGFQPLNNSEHQIGVLCIAARKQYLPKIRVSVSYAELNVHRRNISETSSLWGDTNPWHLFNRAGLQYLNCTPAKTRWEDVWNWREGNCKGADQRRQLGLQSNKKAGKRVKKRQRITRMPAGSQEKRERGR